MIQLLFRMCLHRRTFVVVLLSLISTFTAAQDSVSDLKRLSLEELMDVEVTLVSRQPESLSDVASAIQVLSNEEIRRSTVTRLPEAMRLLPNLHTARLNSYATIISARGFNALYTNKQLVMIDGRTVYSPLFAGVLWDVQNVLMEDIDRIEAISGPGGTLWGANAVNGVINVVTKSSHETQGLYVSGLYGSYLDNWAGIRYGGKLSDKFSYRLYSQRYDFNSFYQPDGNENNDNWNLAQGGFRIDGSPTESDELMFQGNIYEGTEFTVPSESKLNGQNVLGRWIHTFPESSHLILQMYVDRTWRRDVPSSFMINNLTYDLDLQHGFVLGNRHSILWGLGYRLVQNRTEASIEGVGFVPQKRNLPLFSSFIQDEISISDHLKVTIGSKFQHNFYSGLEIQPSVRAAFSPSAGHTVWGAFSRAVRAPSRIDVDFHIPGYDVPPGTPAVDGGPDFVSEKVIASELGYRIQISNASSISLATFYNDYNDLYSVEPLENDTVRYQIMNGTNGYSYGLEISGIYRIMTPWRLRGSYTYFHKDLQTNSDTYDFSALGYDPAHQLMIQSMLDLPGHLQFDIFLRYVDELTDLDVPDYVSGDVRLAWLFNGFELMVAGRNLFRERHQEWGVMEVPRNVYGKITWRL